MWIDPPNLDDRRFEDLVKEAVDEAQRRAPEWTDLGVGDPGRALLEVFAHLTEVMLFRLNRIPEKAYVEFLRMLGVQRVPPTAASAGLLFSLPNPATRAVEIPEGTEVASQVVGPSGTTAVFVTARPLVIEEGMQFAAVTAHHCELVTESLGHSDGTPGLVLRVPEPPIVAPLPDGLDLRVGVEIEEAEAIGAREDAQQREFQGRFFRIWQESRLADIEADSDAYVVDRVSGTLYFAGRPPVQGREIRVWYRRGGGEEGNVPERSITAVKTPIPASLTVENPERAIGGRDGETVEDAVARGPRELHSLARLVTAGDYEAYAHRAPGVARAVAFTQATYWAHARAGTVDLVIVPHVPAARRDGPAVRRSELLLEQQAADAERLRLERAVATRQPLGARCRVLWAPTKEVRIRARIIVHRAEDRNDLKKRLLRILEATLNPLPALEPLPDGTRPSGWTFGMPLRAFHLYEIARREPGVRWVEDVHLDVSEAPSENVKSLAADHHQQGTWFAAAGNQLFRSQNDGDGWELVAQSDRGSIEKVLTHPERAGVAAFLVEGSGDGSASWIFYSADCGDGFRELPRIGWEVRDFALLGEDQVLAAGNQGLQRISVGDSAWQTVKVDRDNDALPLHAVAVGRDKEGRTNVAVAAQQEGGVYLSYQGGDTETYKKLSGMERSEARVLAIEVRQTESFLWVGLDFPSTSGRSAAQSWRLLGSETPVDGWRAHESGWNAGGCTSLAFGDDAVYASSDRGGVMILRRSMEEDSRWERSGEGLPFDAEQDRLKRIESVSVGRRPKAEERERSPEAVMASSGRIHQYDLEAGRFEPCGAKSSRDQVTLPPSWLFCSAEHDLEVVHENEDR